MHNPRVIGKIIRKIQVFFKVQIVIKVPKLVKVQIDYCTKFNISTTNKRIGTEYAKRLSYLTGINMKISLVPYCKEYL